MTPTEEYAAYVCALQAVIDLPKAHAAQIDSIERRARTEIEALDCRRNEGAQRWTQHRDTSARLARRVNDLGGKVGAGPAGPVSVEPLPAAAVPAALESLRSDLDRAEQSWQWLVRHRERERQMALAHAPQPACVAPPLAPPPPPAASPPPKVEINPAVLIGAAAAVIVVLVIVMIAMAL